MNSPRIVGVIDEDPFDYRTWSGSSNFFFTALKENGTLTDAVSADAGIISKRFAQCISFHPNKKEWKRKYHLNTLLFNMMSKTAAKQIINLKKEFDVILQVGAWYNFINKAQFKGKLFCSYHDGNLWAQLKYNKNNYKLNAPYIQKALLYEQKLYNGLDLIFPMSEWLRQIFINDFKCSPEKVIAVGAGINLHRIPKIENKDYSRNNILFVGLDFERKGGQVLLRAFEKVRNAVPDAQLTIVGPDLTNLSQGIKCLGRINKNTLEGEKILLDAYLDASLFVLPSLYEPFGVVFAEAMAHKLPCIGSNVCAMPEIISHGKTGFVIPVGDSNALAESIIQLLQDKNKLKEFGDAGYQKYLNNFTWQKVTEKIINAIMIKLGSGT